MSEEWRSELESLAGELRGQMQALQDEVAALKAALGVAAGVTAQIPEVLDPLWDEVQKLYGQAPEELRPQLQATLSEFAGADSRRRAHLVVELSELCEEHRKSSDPDSPFQRDYPGLLQNLLELAGLESVQPQPGEAYRSGQHMILRSVRGDGPRDRVERCLRRGFRFEGQVVRKAEVSVYL